MSGLVGSAFALSETRYLEDYRRTRPRSSQVGFGIDVVDRLPLHGVVNAHNERYIRTKQHAGHLAGDD